VDKAGARGRRRSWPRATIKSRPQIFSLFVAVEIAFGEDERPTPFIYYGDAIWPIDA
jgi:hypothetical protein